MKENWTIVDVLRHVRHDWMNQLQLIKGNLELNKIDRAKEIMNDIITSAQQESRLTNLKLPRLAELLITFNWRPHRFKIKYEVIDDQINIMKHDEMLTKWFKAFLEKLEEGSASFSDNLLTILIDKQDQQARFFFDYRGTIINKTPIEQFLSEPYHDVQTILVQSHIEDILVFELFISL
ncbi:Spo0B domain-containing protein [Bacillus aquiflavi]|uniref:Spo0B domain-containing protein n=1 Tax=Bacillus aquiflavi TaxID=2672567 RepID=A0A6B3VYX6_9BACI|nr:Spo0B C-terminal domain-containing protein [Bacillus aquiflavi]MBA4537189.1 Spo0B domain-containing protein [Bacillus aquiflavi]NEY81447.1 sporulation protein [Bacillus aquiflavi]UAC47409.1 sporulation initiation phosphotransferase B [Bacillus aquiflavi]